MLYGDLFFPNRWSVAAEAPPPEPGRYYDLTHGQMVDRGFRLLVWLVPVAGVIAC